MSGPTRRTGLVYLALALAGMGGALWFAHRGQSGAGGTVVTLLPSLAGLYLAWAGFRVAARAQASAEPGLAEVADHLAASVRSQWEDEARVRRLNDPYPLPVSWAPVDSGLVEDWSLLRTTAAGWPGGPQSDPQAWAAGPEELAGADAEITDVLLRRVPTRRLAVLGPPGSGKTMLLVRMVLAVVEQRSAGDAVPVLFPLASWNPAAQELDEWLVERLIQDYVGLGEPAPASLSGMSRAQALLDHHLILPILDGFDELPAAVRATALDKVNAALPMGQGVVLSSRAADYRDALAVSSAVPVKLAGAAGIELQPLEPEVVGAYLQRDAGGEGTAAAARWDLLLADLGSQASSALALRTPLMLFLARTIYNPRPGEHTAALPDPAELRDTGRFPDPSSVEAHLFDAFVPAAYRPHPRYPCRWTPRQVERTLVWLARHLQHTLDGTTDIAWWKLHDASPWLVRRVVFGILFGVLCGLEFGYGYGSGFALGYGPCDYPQLCLGYGSGAGFTAGLVRGLESALVASFVFALLPGLLRKSAAVLLSRRRGGRTAAVPAGGLRWSTLRAGFGLTGGLAVGLVTALYVGEQFAVLMLGIGVPTALVVALALGLRSESASVATATGPRTLLVRDRSVFHGLVITLMLAITAGAGLTAALGMDGDGTAAVAFDLAASLGMEPRKTDALAWVLTIQFYGLAFSFSVAATHTSWGRFTFTRYDLALRQRLPRDIMAFLADAHERRGVLRQVGGFYEFRHISLQSRLADRPRCR
ncbi:NACHT domain-containing protein [Streptomyces albipurpureus]|uniref:NACHT domain-containing protein n=1 Tax=Streptomyces albipurpureus TaxID=2897419 RepID=A0ABT0UIL0_9ACTN|nr:NACHT domain-containing protein [Streptomyces sp. CWNU-1]MCM2388308.1 NACHT domain-containing protein [Streptomyces sp. CWNU-1]